MSRSLPHLLTDETFVLRLKIVTDERVPVDVSLERYERRHFLSADGAGEPTQVDRGVCFQRNLAMAVVTLGFVQGFRLRHNDLTKIRHIHAGELLWHLLLLQPKTDTKYQNRKITKFLKQVLNWF